VLFLVRHPDTLDANGSKQVTTTAPANLAKTPVPQSFLRGRAFRPAAPLAIPGGQKRPHPLPPPYPFAIYVKN
jgi:hypothetical protein